MRSAQRTRTPQQKRSRVRVDRLLASADRILGAEGYDALTIARLTEDAGVPVGTFYQFFDDKDAIVDVLASRYVAETRELIANLVGEVLELPSGTRLAAAFEAFVALDRT